MANGAGAGFSEKRFTGDGNGGSAAYTVWKRWARAAVIALKARNTPAEAWGPWLCTLLDGQEALTMKSLGINAINVDGGEEIVLQELDDGSQTKLRKIVLKKPWGKLSQPASTRMRPQRPIRAGQN